MSEKSKKPIFDKFNNFLGWRFTLINVIFMIFGLQGVYKAGELHEEWYSIIIFVISGIIIFAVAHNHGRENHISPNIERFRGSLKPPK